MFKITRDWIHENSTAKKAWTAKQLAVLGVKWPPMRGWLTLQEGRIINEEMKAEFEKWREAKPVNLSWEPLSPEQQHTYDSLKPFWSTPPRK